ncbi:MAG: hypothetical protein Q9223_006632 [Gallowayella weberi]
MPRKRKHLSHEEIWDDSALLNSWDAALQEYQVIFDNLIMFMEPANIRKLYHSIHARGEKVEDVLKQAVDSGQVTMDSPPDMGKTAINGMAQSEELEDGEVEDEQVGEDTLLNGGAEKDAAKTEEIHVNKNQRYSPPLAESEASRNFPQSSVVPMQDEGLKNLMMSWYYAGYYTGLYEGQKQSDAAVAHPVVNGKSKP